MWGFDSTFDVKPQAFQDAARLRKWFAKNVAKETELWVIFYKSDSGRPTVTYAEAVEEALSVGWIDGIVKRIDGERYMQRFTPRRPDSHWSAINIRKAEVLIASGRMAPSGRAAFERRAESRTERYRYENRPADLPPEALGEMKKNRRAWAFWTAQPAGYRRSATWFVVSATRAVTRARRLAAVIEYAARGERISLLAPPGVRPSKRR